VYFCTLCPSVGPKERSRQALDRLPLVSNFLTNFWMEHFDGVRLSPNSVRNAVWHALNEPVCQYLRTRNPRCSTVYIDNSLGRLARDSPCISLRRLQPQCTTLPLLQKSGSTIFAHYVTAALFISILSTVCYSHPPVHNILYVRCKWRQTFGHPSSLISENRCLRSC